jgi:glycosyltransferase involved in cell wall biosynthesis
MFTEFRPLVTIVVPANNAGTTLLETLRSVSDQSYSHLEIIVVDDGSKDRTFELASQYSLRDPRVRVVRQRNAGVAHARNHGIQLASGVYIAPIDADDLWHPRKIELQLAVVQKYPEGRSIVYNWYAAIDRNNVIFGHSKPVRHEGDVLELLIRENFIGNGSTPLMPRADVLACGGYDPSLRDQGAEGCEDLKLYLALAERLPFSVAPEFLTGYRFTPGNMSSNAYRMLRSYSLVLGEITRRHPELAAVAMIAKFETERWYFKKAIADRDWVQVRKLVQMRFGHIPSELARNTVWRAVKGQISRLSKLAVRTPNCAPPAWSRINTPENGTSIYSHFAVEIELPKTGNIEIKPKGASSR